MTISGHNCGQKSLIYHFTALTVSVLVVYWCIFKVRIHSSLTDYK